MASSDDVVGDLSPTQRCLYLAPMWRSVCKREEFVELLRTIGPFVEAALCRSETAEGDLQGQTSGDTDDLPETDPCRAGLVVQDLVDRLEWEDWWWEAVAECFPMLSRWNRLSVLATHSCEYILYLCQGSVGQCGIVHAADYLPYPQGTQDVNGKITTKHRRTMPTASYLQFIQIQFVWTQIFPT